MYFLPYFFILVILFILYLAESGKIKLCSKKAARWSAFVIMWFFMGFRGHIMSDFIGYFPFFNSMPNLFSLSATDFIIRREEPGFIIYTAIIKLFTDNYFAWVAINTLIDLIVLVWFFQKYSQSMILPLIFFIAYNGLLMEFNLYRNMKAIDLFLLSIPYLNDRKMLPYMLLNILGMFFHTSALLYIPLYFILTIKMPIWLIWLGFIISNTIFLLKLSVIGDIINNISVIQGISAYDKFLGYASVGVESKISFGFLERMVAFVLFFSFYSPVINKNPVYRIFYNCFWIYYCSILIFYEVLVFAERIPYLFMFSYWIIYPKMIEIKSKYQSIIKIYVSILILMKVFIAYNTPATSYENCLFSKPDYYKRREIYERQQLDQER